MCSKNIHNLKDWRNEMMRLRKEHAPLFETHPDYIKTAQCKEDILTKPECDRLPRKPSPKPPKSQRYNPTSPPKPRPKPKPQPNASQQYQDYLKRFAEYNINKAQLKRLKELFMTLNRERSILIVKLNSAIAQLDNAKAILILHMENFLSRLESMSEKMIKAHKAELKRTKEAIAKLEEIKKDYELQLQGKEKYISSILEEIEVLSIKTEVRPVPPPNYKEPKTTKTRTKRTNTAKASPPKPQPQPKKTTLDPQYQAYLKKLYEYKIKLKEYNLNKKKLQKANYMLLTLSIEHSKLILNLNSIITQIDAKNKLTVKKEELKRLEETKKEYELQLQEKKKYMSIIQDEIKVLIKTDIPPVEPSPPVGYPKANKTRSRKAPTDPKAPKQKRCPNGTRRNKITKLCEKN